MLSLLAEAADLVAEDGRDEQADSVRAHVDDPDLHAGHSREHPGQTPPPFHLLRAPPALRVRSRARRWRLSWWLCVRSSFPRFRRVQVPSGASSQDDAVSANELSKIATSSCRSRGWSTGTTTSIRRSRFRVIRS